MAHCVLSQIVDTDRGDAVVLACMIHGVHAPCGRDGQPAIPIPMHGWAADRDGIIRLWEICTDRQRPLIIHNLTVITDHDRHVVKDEVRPCPCGAEILPAETGPQ